MASHSLKADPATVHGQLNNLRVGIATISLGYANAHGIDAKLKACSDAGIQGIEVFPHDLETSGDVSLDAREAATLVRGLCDRYKLEVISLQPFRNYEGLIDQTRRRQKLDELKGYFALCKILRTTLIGVPAMFITDPSIATGERKIIERDLADMASMGQKEDPTINFAYEAVAWSPHVSRWQDAWDLVQRIDQPNLGMCIDTFQVLARVWADPGRVDGKRPKADELLKTDLQELTKALQAEKIFLIQAADAELIHPSLTMEYSWRVQGQHPLMSWSRKARLFPLENDRGGYLPVTQVLKACVLDLGYRGWISMEVFNDSLALKDASIPGTYASRGMLAWRKCVDALAMEATAVKAENGEVPE